MPEVAGIVVVGSEGGGGGNAGPEGGIRGCDRGGSVAGIDPFSSDGGGGSSRCGTVPSPRGISRLAAAVVLVVASTIGEGDPVTVAQARAAGSPARSVDAVEAAGAVVRPRSDCETKGGCVVEAC